MSRKSGCGVHKILSSVGGMTIRLEGERQLLVQLEVFFFTGSLNIIG